MKRLGIALLVAVALLVIGVSLPLLFIAWSLPRHPDLTHDEDVVAEKVRQAAVRTTANDALQKELLARAETAASPRDALAEGFRKTFPFHTQVLALSGPAPDGSRTLLISEPPP